MTVPPPPRRAPLQPPPAAVAHDGETYDPAVDAAPLNAQQQAVWDTMTLVPRWWTLRELADRTGYPEASVSARLRDLRKPKWGGHLVERRRRGDTRQWEYRLTPRSTP